METRSRSEADLGELGNRISWLIRLRWLATAGTFAVIALAPPLVGVRLEQRPLYAITAGLAAYNLVLWVVGRWLPRFSAGPALPWFANLQIGADLAFLTALLHFSGGVENPFVCCYVFHIVMASILLSSAATYSQATLALALVSGMAALEATGRLAHYRLGLLHLEFYRDPRSLVAVLFAIGTMLYVSAFMATSITARLRRREAEVMRLSVSLQEHAAEVERAYASLGSLEREKSDYLHRAAHHLRSPLASIENLLAVVSEGRTGPQTEKSHEMLERARLKVRHMLDLARDLLVLSRAHEVAPLARSETVDLAAVLGEVTEDFRQHAAAAAVSLSASCDAALSEVPGHRELLVELIENLVSNAIKYTPAGGRVQLDVRRRDDRVEIRVSDSGIGIPPDEQPLVFDEFYRARNARESGKEGTGLGLCIVRAAAEAHHGSVSIESEAGAGTTVRVMLPASPWHESAR